MLLTALWEGRVQGLHAEAHLCGFARTHSLTGLIRAQGQHTQAHLCGVCTHTQPHGAHQGMGLYTQVHLCGVYTCTQPRRAHQGAGSAHTGTLAWGVHAHTASQGSSGCGICTHRYTCVGCTHAHNLTGLTRAWGLHAEAHVCGVCTHTQPHGAHQGAEAVLCSLRGWRGLSGQG